LSRYIDLQRWSIFIQSACFYCDWSFGLFYVHLTVIDKCFEGLDDGLKSGRAGIEKIETDYRHDEKLCWENGLIHCGFGTVDEKSKNWHEVAFAIVD